MSAENYPPSISQTLPVGYSLNTGGANYTLVAGATNTFLLRNADGTQKYLNLPAGNWVFTTYVSLAYTNGVYTIPQLLVNTNEYDALGNNLGNFSALTCCSNMAVLAGCPATDFSSTGYVSKTTPFKMSLGIVATSTVSPTTISNISIYAQYMGEAGVSNA